MLKGPFENHPLALTIFVGALSGAMWAASGRNGGRRAGPKADRDVGADGDG